MPIDNDFGGPFPLTSLLGVSGIGGGMSDEDIAWQSYLDYSGLSQTGGSGVYDFEKDLTEEIIAMHSNPEDIDNYIGTREEVIDLLTPATMEEITVTEKKPPFYKGIISTLQDPDLNIQDKIWEITYALQPGEAPSGPTKIDSFKKNIIDPTQKYIGPIKDRYWDPIQKRYIDPTIENISERVNEVYDNAEYAVQKEIYETYKNEPWFDREPPIDPKGKVDTSTETEIEGAEGEGIEDVLDNLTNV